MVGGESTSRDNENRTGTRPDDEEPLLETGAFARLSSIKILLIALSIIIVFGGISVGIWLLVDNGPTGSSPSSPFQLVNRSSWGALPPKEKTPLPHPPATLVVIIHTDSTPCDTLDTCSEAVREIQRAHLKKYSDIAFNFLVGGDGRVYEGRGWDLQGAFARSFNNVSLGVAFIGKFGNVAPPNQQLEEARALIDVSLKNNKLPSAYKLVGHRQVTDTDSPGDALFNIIKTWPHWEDCYMSTCRPAKSRTSDFIR